GSSGRVIVLIDSADKLVSPSIPWCSHLDTRDVEHMPCRQEVSVPARPVHYRGARDAAPVVTKDPIPIEVLGCPLEALVRRRGGKACQWVALESRDDSRARVV